MRHHRLAPVIGHRGVPYLAPENSLLGLESAAGLGYRCCEIDVQASSDGVGMVFHDSGPNQVFDGRVSDRTAADLQKVVIGHAGDQREEVCMPSLAQCLEMAHECGLTLVVEIKSRPGRGHIDAEAALAAIEAGPPVHLMVASFEPEALEAVAQSKPEIPQALNTIDLPAEPPPRVANVHFDARRAHPGEVAKIVDAGLGVYAYTVNSVEERDRLFAMGVHGVFTDNPNLLLADGD